MQTHDGCPCHLFKCAAKTCKTSAGGVCHFLDKGDRASTANLKYHAIKCLGEDAVHLAAKGVTPQENLSGSIFAAFARHGQQPVQVSHRSHTTIEARAHLVKWITESNRPTAIINDRELRMLLTAGRPKLELPSAFTVHCDIRAVFEKCRDRIASLLQNHPGRLHFAYDTWTSPNHQAICAWTVHLEHDGEPLSFLLDVVDIPESHTGATLAREFQDMLVRFGIKDKILSFNADNALPNDKQTSKLADLPNSFEAVNRVRCFNHTMQLSARTLLAPFNAALGQALDVLEEDGDEMDEDDEMVSDGDSDDHGNGKSDNDDEDEEVDEDGQNEEECDDPDDSIDELQTMSEEDRTRILEETCVVRTTVTKIRKLAFAIINSTTVALPAWHCLCKLHKLVSKLMPRDVVTWWNSTYDLLQFSLKYREAIDAITADKTLKFRKYELYDEDWAIVRDLTAVLQQYKNATLYFSSDSANIATVIPAMDRIDNKLNTQTKQPIHPAIVSAMKLARRKLNRYYSLTDLSSVYQIAMGMSSSSALNPVLICFEFSILDSN